jgi:uncharacterized protein YcgI (DUF1989 family)
MKRILEHVIPPKLGYGLLLEEGQHLRVVDLEGKQVVDMALFNEANPGRSCRPPTRAPSRCPAPGTTWSSGPR